MYLSPPSWLRLLVEKLRLLWQAITSFSCLFPNVKPIYLKMKVSVINLLIEYTMKPRKMGLYYIKPDHVGGKLC